ncbi:MAG: hypothetical protein ACK5L0_02450 [Candidatus Fimivivens sp.]
MKKTLALSLATAMMLSMGAAASAANDDALYPVGAISDSAYLYSSDASAVDMANPVESVAYGKTLYYPLLNNAEAPAEPFTYVYESDAVSGIKVKADWDMNGKLVKSVEIAKKKVTGEDLSQKYIYFLAVTLDNSTSTSSIDVIGNVEMRKSGSFDYEEMQLDVNMEVAYPVANEAVITEDLQLFKEGTGFVGDSEEEFTFECDDDSYFTVNTVGQSKLLLAASTDFDSDIADLYPDANLNFFYGNGATFNKTGVLTLAADEGSFLYQLKDDGMVRLNAEYDEYDEAFTVKTKTLGKYIVSDTELTIVDIPSDNGNVDNGGDASGNVNPGTGAAL